MQPPNPPPQRPGLRERLDDVPGPSRGRGNPYSQDMRTLVMAVNRLGPLPDDVAEFIAELRLNRVYPSVHRGVYDGIF